MKLKRLLVALLASCVAFSSLACFGGGGGGADVDFDPTAGIDGDVTISFWGWGGVDEQQNYQTLVDMFMDENPNITVVYEGATADEHMLNLQNEIDNLPDLFYIPDYSFIEYADAGRLMNIAPGMTDAELDKLWEVAADTYYYDRDTALLGKSDTAKLYGLPKDLGPFTLVYNKNLLQTRINAVKSTSGFDQSFIDDCLSTTTPMTWDNFCDLLTMLYPNGCDNSSGYGISHYELDAAVYSNNANYFTDDAATSRITETAFTDALQFVADLALVHDVMPEVDESADNGYENFKNGKALFSFMGPWDCADFWATIDSGNKFEWDVIPVPYGPGGDRVYGTADDGRSTAWVGSVAYCISANTTQKKAAAALKLAKYLCLDEGAQRKFYELGQQVPNIKSMALGEYLDDTNTVFAAKNPPSRSVFVDIMDGFGENDVVGGKARARYYTASSTWWTEMMDRFSLYGLWVTQNKAAQICEEYEDEFQYILDDMQSELGH